MTSQSQGRGTGSGKEQEIRPEVFDSYDAFLKQAIRDYYERGWKNRRASFIALVIASGQAASLATDSLKDGSGLKKAAIGAAGLVALRVGLRYALSGPLGIILTGAALASAASYFVKHKGDIGGKVDHCRKLVAETRTRFEEIQGGYRAGRYDAAGRNLMVDVLLKRFLEQVDETTSA
jgi:hypothetical protein